MRDAVDHDDLPARPGSYAIVRLYDYDKRSKHGKASLWWTLAEILAVVEGDGISPDSLLEVRLFKNTSSMLTRNLCGNQRRVERERPVDFTQVNRPLKRFVQRRPHKVTTRRDCLHRRQALGRRQRPPGKTRRRHERRVGRGARRTER